MSAGPAYDPGSFRDPDSRVIVSNGEVLRLLGTKGADHWDALAGSGLLQRLVDANQLIPTERLSDAEEIPDLGSAQPAAVLSHERVPFITYPYEWPFSMLRDAAALQLDILRQALDCGLTLKDASPYNVQFVGSRPLFIDIGSFRPQSDGLPWLGYRQFCMLFLYPMMLRSHLGVPHGPWLRGSLSGIEPGQMNMLMRGRARWKAGVFKHVRLHARLEQRYAASDGEVKGDLKRAGFGVEIVKANVRAMGKLVRKLDWRSGGSTWSDYGSSNEYGEHDERRKLAFVRDAAEQIRPDRLWDLGCNDGKYTDVAAQFAKGTIAIEGDEAVADRYYRELRDRPESTITTLTMDLTDPSPRLGWRGGERTALADRGRPDLVLVLALLHHLSISGNVPVSELLDWLRSLDTALVLEFVTREDPMVKLLLSRYESEPRPDYELKNFEERLSERFRVVRREVICGGRRVLFLAQPR